MIEVEEALRILEEIPISFKTRKKKTNRALGYVLAKGIVSPINMPPFRQSSMDGYALKQTKKASYKVIDEIRAGEGKDILINEGEAVRIFTGARVPNDADTIIMQEQTERKGEIVTILKEPKVNQNVRPVGEQLKQGDFVLEKGTLLNERSLGLLLSIGVSEVTVYRKPKLSILVTGDELQKVGKTLKEGQVYESNSKTLKFALKRMGIHEINTIESPDHLSATKKAIKKGLKKSDLLLISGGISVGKYDFVKQALAENGAQEHFYKVNQKPGKPLWFGTKEEKIIFALPGNPGSSLTCFYVYVVPILHRLMGLTSKGLSKRKGVVTVDLKNQSGKTLFLKAKKEEEKLTPLSGQASSMLLSFAKANALIIHPASKNEFKKGEDVSYINLP